MTRVAFVDVIGGAAGDMLLAALIDAGASLSDVLEAVERVVPGRFSVGTEEVWRGGLRARFLHVEPGPSAATEGSRSIRDLIGSVERAELKVAVRDAAVAVLRRLGEAEAQVHGVADDDVILHELGDDDTLLDVVGVAAAMQALGVERLLVSSVPLSVGGVVAGADGHAGLPQPAPATVELLRGFDLRNAPPDAGETVTPTAAAIFAALGSPSTGAPSLRLMATGYGAGARDPDGYPNVVRVLIGETSEDARAGDEGLRMRSLVVMEANIDDLTPELAADGADALARAGALDVWITPVQMKKGRPGMILSALAEPALESRLRHVFFETTTTFGVRTTPVARAELERTVEAVDLPGGARVRIKVGWLGGRVVSATPEHDDVAAVAAQAGLPVRQVYAEAVAAARLLLGSGAER